MLAQRVNKLGEAWKDRDEISCREELLRLAAEALLLAGTDPLFADDLSQRRKAQAIVRESQRMQ